jgi:hypothetical protein
MIMDMIDLKELVTRLENKEVVEAGSTFEMFGSTYVAIKTEAKNPCEKCAFANANCNFNIDIPSCNNGVYFRKVKSITLKICNKNDEIVGNVDKIENDIVYFDTKSTVRIASLYKFDWVIKPMVEFE